MFIVFDGTAMAYRTLYAHQDLGPLLKDKKISSRGLAKNIDLFVYSFFDDLQGAILKIIKEYGLKEYSVIVVFDQRTSKALRRQSYKEYGKKKTPKELEKHISVYPLLDTFREILLAYAPRLGISFSVCEADDIIAFVVKNTAALDFDTCIVGRDKDLYCLLGKTVTMFDPWTNQFHNTANFIEKWGFSPEWFPIYKAIVGDKSDNIPGIPRFGDVKAKKMIAAAIECDHSSAKFAKIDVPSEHQTAFLQALELVTIPYRNLSDSESCVILETIGDILVEPIDLESVCKKVFKSDRTAKKIYQEYRQWLI